MIDSQRLEGLDLARFLAAFIVTMGHLLFVESLISEWAFRQEFLYIFRFGSLSVAFFFCLSGFVLSRQLSQINRSPFVWIFARLVRLLPLYYFCWLIPMAFYIVLAQSNGGALLPNGWRSALLGLTASQSWTSAYLDLPNPPLWSLSVEVWLSLILALISILSTSRKMIAIIALLFLIYRIAFPEFGNAVINSIHLFLFGVLLNNNYFLVLLNRKLSKPVLGIALSLLFVPIYKFVIFNEIHRLMDLIVILFTSLVILSFARIKIGQGIASAVQYLSARTYSLYAVHFPILVFLTNVESTLTDLNPFVYIFLTLLLIFLATEFSYRFIEKPSLDLSRRIRRNPNSY